MTETLQTITLARTLLAEKERQIATLELTINDFRLTAGELDQQIRVEQKLAGVTDVQHFAYPMFAKAATARRDNLLSSIADLQDRLEGMREECGALRNQIAASDAESRMELHHQKKMERRRLPGLFLVPEPAQ